MGLEVEVVGTSKDRSEVEGNSTCRLPEGTCSGSIVVVAEEPVGRETVEKVVHELRVPVSVEGAFLKYGSSDAMFGESEA